MVIIRQFMLKLNPILIAIDVSQNQNVYKTFWKSYQQNVPAVILQACTWDDTIMVYIHGPR